MSNPIDTLLAGIKMGMEAAMPTRIITRSFKPHEQYKPAQLEKGVVTLLSNGEKDYSNVLGRLAEEGTLGLIIIGQIRVKEKAEGIDVEQAELDLVHELKEFCRQPPAGIAITMLSFSQSGQLECPYGFISVDAEVMT